MSEQHDGGPASRSRHTLHYWRGYGWHCFREGTPW